MKLLQNEPLKKHTTIQIGGIAKQFIIPETVEELVDIIGKVDNPKLIGGGSNLLINEREFENVISLKEFNNNIRSLGDGVYEVGASVRLQKLILTINSEGYGGIEYLFSVPGLVGGAVIMNAGGSKEQGFCISDHIISVTVLKKGKIISLTREHCNFSHRGSLFKNDSDYIILSVQCYFHKGTEKYFKEQREKRIQFCRETQDNTEPNCGSVFAVFDPYIMEIMRRISFGKKGKAHFSHKTGNWIINENNGTFSQVYALINKVILFHKIFRKKCKLEVVIWK